MTIRNSSGCGQTGKGAWLRPRNLQVRVLPPAPNFRKGQRDLALRDAPTGASQGEEANTMTFLMLRLEVRGKSRRKALLHGHSGAWCNGRHTASRPPALRVRLPPLLPFIDGDLAKPVKAMRSKRMSLPGSTPGVPTRRRKKREAFPSPVCKTGGEKPRGGRRVVQLHRLPPE